MTWSVLTGDCRDVLPTLPERSVHTVCTSPPYFGLRDYGTGEWEGGDSACEHIREDTGHGGLSSVPCARGAGGALVPSGGEQSKRSLTGQYRAVCGQCGALRVDRQIGLEPTPDEFVQALVQVFREVRRVLRDDGTVWLNLGDSYFSATATQGRNESKSTHAFGDRSHGANGRSPALDAQTPTTYRRTAVGTKPKDLIGIPWMVAFALRADGWYLRSDIIWAKSNPMPESVTDRPTKAHEYVFLLSKRASYFYDAEAIKEPQSAASLADHLRRGPSERSNGAAPDRGPGDQGLRQNGVMTSGYRNRRDVWTVATQPFADAHFATFPPDLIEPCVLAGCPEGGTVLDPFAGAGTTGLVAVRTKRAFIGIELNEAYAQMARDRIETDIRLGHRPPVRVDVAEGQPSLFGEAA